MPGKARSFDEDKKREFINALADCGNVSMAARTVGVPRRTVYEARKQDEEFAEAWDFALDEAGDRLEYEAYRRAVQGVDRPIYQKGELIGHERVYSDRLLLRLLEAAKPEKFRHRTEAKVVDDPLQNVLDAIDGDSASPNGPDNQGAAE